MAQTNQTALPEQADVLAEATLNACRALGVDQKTLARIIGRDRSSISRHGIPPESKAGELALLLIRLYRALHVLVGGEARQMRHWMRTENRHLGGTPLARIQKVEGLIRVVNYLDGFRGKI